MPLTDEARSSLEALVNKDKVVLFMKGNRQFPQCGFSAQVVALLNQAAARYQTVNVLADPAVRDGMKEYSQWPTFPQLYVKGELVGGCDIVKEMAASGELAKLLSDAGAIAPKGAASAAPKVRVSERARAAIAHAREGIEAEDDLRLGIDAAFRYDLCFGPREEGDVVVDAGGLTLRMDAESAARADGLDIDFVEGPAGAGFRIVSPHEPPRVRPMSVEELRDARARGEALELFDVRTASERSIACIDGARWLDPEGEAFLKALDRATPVVFHCHHGMRSRTAAEKAVRAGFRVVYNLEGGIAAWSARIDPRVPTY